MTYSENNSYKLIQGDMMEELKNLPENSVDSIITDPPYELGFMNKSWDSSGIAFQVNTWKECLRVLKPGGHMLAFGGSRTYHRIACAIEDAGFEIRDCVIWLYGSGFPKSMNIGLAIDKQNGIQGDVLYTVNTQDFMDSGKQQVEISGINKRTFGQAENIKRMQYEVRTATNVWNGWGTCLKPAYEPIILARKPVEDSIISNCQKWGVGGINIDECRVPFQGASDIREYENNNDANLRTKDNLSGLFQGNWKIIEGKKAIPEGRFPANVITDGSDEVAEGMPNSGSGNNGQPYNYAGREYNNKDTSMFNGDKPQAPSNYNDNGSAMRYFYCAKASRKDRDEGCIEKNYHPCVKPCELMQYLIRLISPKGATILDPFMGSGSTGKAVMFENKERNADYKFIGIELTEEYLPIAKARIDFAIGYLPVPENHEADFVTEKDTEQEVCIKESLF